MPFHPANRPTRCLGCSREWQCRSRKRLIDLSNSSSGAKSAQIWRERPWHRKRKALGPSQRTAAAMRPPTLSSFLGATSEIQVIRPRRQPSLLRAKPPASTPTRPTPEQTALPMNLHPSGTLMHYTGASPHLGPSLSAPFFHHHTYLHHKLPLPCRPAGCLPGLANSAVSCIGKRGSARPAGR